MKVDNIAKDSTGIHTFMLTSSLTYEKYRELKLILQRSVWAKVETENSSYIKSKHFMDNGYYGLYAKLYMQNTFAYIEIIVNPINLLKDEYTQTQLFSNTFNCKDMIKKLNHALSSINMHTSMLTLSRVDLCINFIFTPIITETYIKLGRKSYYQNKVKEVTFKNEERNKHSLTLKCNTFEIEIYDKEYEVANRTKQEIINPDFGSILRIELRLYRDIIWRYNKEWGLSKLHKILIHLLNEEMEILYHYIDYCFYKGNYMSLDYARLIIQSCSYSNKTKTQMIEILKCKTKSDKVFENFQKSKLLSDKSVARLKNKFDKCNINFITIPIRYSIDCGDSLPGFSELICSAPNNGIQ